MILVAILVGSLCIVGVFMLYRRGRELYLEEGRRRLNSVEGIATRKDTIEFWDYWVHGGGQCEEVKMTPIRMVLCELRGLPPSPWAEEQQHENTL